MPIQENDAWNWQVWRVRTGQPDEWVGFFGSEQDALAWRKTQPGFYVINNCPPPREEDLARPDYRAPRRFKATDVAAPQKAAPWKRPAPAKPTPETEAQKALRLDAAKRLDKIKIDEAADLAAEADKN